MKRSVAVGLVVVVLACGSTPAHARAWRHYVRAASRYAEGRAGTVAFAVVGSRGRLHHHLGATQMPSASVLKVMFLVAYLRRSEVRDRRLHDSDRALLGPMIKRSDNASASRVANIVGESGMNALARKARMRHFRYTRPWGLSIVTPNDQARFMSKLERYVPERHERYARRLLADVVSSQRWGLAAFADDSLPAWKLFFKGGWGSGTGWVDHQVAFLQKGERRVAVGIFTHNNPSHAYGIATLRGVARRLLGHLR